MWKDLRTTIAAWTIDILGFIVHALPFNWQMKAIRGIGWLYAHLPHGQRRALEENLKTFLNFTPEQIKSARLRVFVNFVFTLYDFFFPQGLILTVPEKAMLEELRNKHGGVLFLTFHMGNWELGARVMSQWGWPVTAVYQPYTNKKFKDLIEKRRAPGVNFIPVGGNAANGVREALRRGDVVAMLGDHAFGEDGVAVDLLGHRVVWPKGPVLLAVRENAPIVIAVIIRTASRQYKALVEAPIVPRDRSRAEVERIVQEVADKFGGLVREYPEQWYRFREFERAAVGVKKQAGEKRPAEDGADELELARKL